jgi:ferredoxin-NADP reductase
MSEASGFLPSWLALKLTAEGLRRKEKTGLTDLRGPGQKPRHRADEAEERTDRLSSRHVEVPPHRVADGHLNRGQGFLVATTIHLSALRSRQTVAEGTMAFHFDRPEGFAFKAGQYMIVTLRNPPETDAEGNTRTFTIASAPSDPDLMITTRMRDTAFKRVLRSIALPAEVKIAGPYGGFTLHNDPDRPAIFLAGGIGITPFFSISVQAARDKLPRQLYLFHSNRRPEDAAFLTALLDLAGQNSNFHFVPTMTEMEKSKAEWTGERGFINREMLERHLPSLQGPIYYIAGPPAMVKAMREMATAAGVNQADIRTEQFSGY